MTPTLDQQFAVQSEKSGIGVAKLKTVYFRGIEEYQKSDFDLGSATMWGLARVQRFINAVSNGEDPAADKDLIATDAPVYETPSVEFNLDSSAILADVLYSTGSHVTELFYPAHVEYMCVNDNTLEVTGTLDGTTWTYRLDTDSGDHNLSIE